MVWATLLGSCSVFGLTGGVFGIGDRANREPDIFVLDIFAEVAVDLAIGIADEIGDSKTGAFISQFKRVVPISLTC